MRANLILHHFKERFVVLVEAEFVVQLCRGQGEDQGSQVHEERDGTRTKGDHLLEVEEAQVREVIP